MANKKNGTLKGNENQGQSSRTSTVQKELERIPKSTTEQHEQKPQRGAGFYHLKVLMNVRDKPSLNGQVVGILAAGTIVSVSEIKSDWMHLEDGRFILYGNGDFAEKI